ncbi:NAD(P)-binding protein [Trematosphaeria pertusa]|uniref:NAD(P)-binding protein n=1 Tax=Trematosphaeria pertusa TaxID=390896 RepID=A0A6A6I546_9PLEO|nr:NAD(P)-binding protein [Trematosphaeria pertusa]KAF2245471.1 NAD(P)-binding protein [Trematosphaeria pertusa]
MPADPSNDLLLLTCASGKQATALLPLLSQWKRLRLAVKSSSSKERLQQQYPHAEVIQTDLYSPTNTAALMGGVNVVIHIGPSYHPHETEIGYMMIDAAVQEYGSGKGGLNHFILSSVLNTQFRKMMNHDCKRYIEEYIMESGLPYTILQPSTFMDNTPLPMLMSQEQPVFRSAWSTDVKFSWVALRDLAAVMHTMLIEREKHFYAQYPLVSTHSTLSFGEAMGIISKKIGKEIKVEVAEFREGVDNTLVRVYGTSEGIDQRSRDAAQRMILFYDNRGLIGNSNVLEWVIGRKATQFDEWVDGKVGEAGGRK